MKHVVSQTKQDELWNAVKMSECIKPVNRCKVIFLNISSMIHRQTLNPPGFPIHPIIIRHFYYFEQPIIAPLFCKIIAKKIFFFTQKRMFSPPSVFYVWLSKLLWIIFTFIQHNSKSTHTYSALYKVCYYLPTCFIFTSSKCCLWHIFH